MTEVVDISCLVSQQETLYFNHIEFEFDDAQTEPQTPNQSHLHEKDQSLLKVLDDSGEICEENQEEFEQTQNQESIIPEDPDSILEERLSDYELDEHYEEERLSDYETTDKNIEHCSKPNSVECNTSIEHNEDHETPRILNYETNNDCRSPKILNYSLNPKSELPIIRKAPIIITSKLLSSDNMKQRYSKKPVNENVKTDSCTPKTFRVVTSSKTLTNSANKSKTTVVNKEISIEPEENYNSDSEVLLGFDSHSRDFKTKHDYRIDPKICFKTDPNSNSQTENHNSNQTKTVSATEFNKFQNSLNSTPPSENSKTITKLPNTSASNFSFNSKNFDSPSKFLNRITKAGNRTIITKVSPNLLTNICGKTNEPANRIKRTSDEMNVAMAMQKLQETDSVENSYKRQRKTRTQEEQIEYALAKLFMECDIPLCVVEDPNFKEVVRLLKPSYASKLPNSKVLLEAILKL